MSTNTAPGGGTTVELTGPGSRDTSATMGRSPAPTPTQPDEKVRCGGAVEGLSGSWLWRESGDGVSP